MMGNKINISEDFSFTPGPRYKREGKFSGEEFRNDLLYPEVKKAIEQDYILDIILDGVAGYGTSFLEEAFGGLIRENHLTYDSIKSHIHVISDEEEYLCDDIDEYMKDAQKEAEKN